MPEQVVNTQTQLDTQLGATDNNVDMGNIDESEMIDQESTAKDVLSDADADEDSDMEISDTELDKENKSHSGSFGAIGDHLKRPRTPLGEIPYDLIEESESSIPPNPNYSKKPKIFSTIKLHSIREVIKLNKPPLPSRSPSPPPILTASEQAEQDAVRMNTLLNSGLVAKVYFGEVVPPILWERLSEKERDLLWIVHNAAKGEEVNAMINEMINMSCQLLDIETNESEDNGEDNGDDVE